MIRIQPIKTMLLCLAFAAAAALAQGESQPKLDAVNLSAGMHVSYKAI